MIPLRDTISTRTVPFVTRLLVIVNVAVFLLELLQAFLSSSSTVPNLGASGAIAGILGAYFVYYPRARVVTVIPLFILFPLIEVPAGLYLLGWFALQFWMGSAQLTRAGRAAAGGGGVAFWAHVGGFVVGVTWALLFRPAREPAARYRI